MSCAVATKQQNKKRHILTELLIVQNHNLREQQKYTRRQHVGTFVNKPKCNMMIGPRFWPVIQVGQQQIPRQRTGQTKHTQLIELREQIACFSTKSRSRNKDLSKSACSSVFPCVL